MMHRHAVFVYATLTSRLVRTLVCRERVSSRDASLPGFRRHRRTLIPTPDGVTSGACLEVTDAQLCRLDRYERCGEKYERLFHTLEDGTRAWVYHRRASMPFRYQ